MPLIYEAAFTVDLTNFLFVFERLIKRSPYRQFLTENFYVLTIFFKSEIKFIYYSILNFLFHL